MISLAALEWKALPQPGGPLQRMAQESLFDGERVQFGVWECGAGELLLEFAWHETVFILEGEAIAEELGSGERIALAPGVLAHFERGSRWRWTVPSCLRKVFTIVDLEQP